jgi:hypothetical protein
VKYSVSSARAAGDRGELADWVAGFLSSPGSDNGALAAALVGEIEHWVGPVLLPIDRLERLAGPPGDPVLCPVGDDFWDERVDDIEETAERGGELPPVIVAYRDGRLVLEDGNHRVEGARRAGRRCGWGVVGFRHLDERDSFDASFEGR